MRIDDALALLAPMLADAPPLAGGEASFAARDWIGGDGPGGNGHDRRWRDLGLYAVDRAIVRAEPTPANLGAFEAVGTGKAARPEVRITALMAMRSRLVTAALIGRHTLGEAARALPVPERSLTAFDDLDVEALARVEQQGGERHWIAAAGARSSWRLVKSFDARTGDGLVEVRLPPAVRAGGSSYAVARIIEYDRVGYPQAVLITSLREPPRYPFYELVSVHSELWASRLGEHSPVLRHKAVAGAEPDAVHARLWTLLGAYNLVRTQLCACAAELGVEPRALSFARALEQAGADAVQRALQASSTQPLEGLRASARELMLDAPDSPVRVGMAQMA